MNKLHVHVHKHGKIHVVDMEWETDMATEKHGDRHGNKETDKDMEISVAEPCHFA
jgi:hypothetical protein